MPDRSYCERQDRASLIMSDIVTTPPTRVVLDTSLFVNPEVRTSIGATPTEALNAFVELAKNTQGVEFYMPPSIYEELMNFVQRDNLSGEVMRYLRQKPPARYELTVPALFMYEFVEEMRERVNKGLRIAEKTLRSLPSTTTDEALKELRRKYRDALREGIIDSKEDVDLILLAKELGAVLVTADLGAVTWAEKLGIPWVLPEKFHDFVKAFLPADFVQLHNTQQPQDTPTDAA